ncbi:MAG TPA: YciI family protein [Bryobacteraceae bacterium]|nr:YciI family protein [Bryobacteraceae bacterium]
MRPMLLLVLSAWILPGQPAMETYQIAFLRPDPARKPLTKEDAQRIQTAHMANIHSMADRGLMVAAGPFDDTPPTISGIFVFKMDSPDEASKVANEDPTVVEHRNTIDVHTWLGPKGIGEEYIRLHKEDPKTPEGMGVQPFFILFRTAAWERESPPLKEHAAYVAISSGKENWPPPVRSPGTIAWPRF